MTNYQPPTTNYPLKGVIFDLDGVVVNTVPLHFESWKKMFGEYGKKFTFKDYKEKVDGIPRLQGAKAILKELDNNELEKAAAKKQKYFLELLKKRGVRIYKSTIELIKKLKNKNIKIALISSSRNCPFIIKKAKIDKLFDAVISGDQIKRGKPYPDIFLLAAKKLKLNVRNCLVIEDAQLGVEAAKKGKFKCLGIDRHNDPSRLKRADLVVKDLREISLRKLMKIVNS